MVKKDLKDIKFLKILKILYLEGKPMSYKQLSKITGYSKSTIYKSLLYLKRRYLIKKEEITYPSMNDKKTGRFIKGHTGRKKGFLYCINENSIENIKKTVDCLG